MGKRRLVEAVGTQHQHLPLSLYICECDEQYHLPTSSSDTAHLHLTKYKEGRDADVEMIEGPTLEKKRPADDQLHLPAAMYLNLTLLTVQLFLLLFILVTLAVGPLFFMSIPHALRLIFVEDLLQFLRYQYHLLLRSLGLQLS